MRWIYWTSGTKGLPTIAAPEMNWKSLNLWHFGSFKLDSLFQKKKTKSYLTWYLHGEKCAAQITNGWWSVLMDNTARGIVAKCYNYLVVIVLPLCNIYMSKIANFLAVWRYCDPNTVYTSFFRFDIQNFRNGTASGVPAPAPFTRSTPPYGKSWIHHCSCIFAVYHLASRRTHVWPHSVADPGFPRREGVDLVGRGVDSRGGYVSKILYVKTKESGPLGGACSGQPPPRSANDTCF